MGCKTSVWSRVTGFFRPVNDWNKGKTCEFKDRKEYNVDWRGNGKNRGGAEVDVRNKRGTK